MSLAEKRSGVDGEDDEIVDLRELALGLGAMESDAVERLSSDAIGMDGVEVGDVCEARERGNPEVLAKADGADTNENHDIDEGSENSTSGNEGHGILGAHVLDDSDGHNASSGSNLDVDEHDNGIPSVEHEENEQEESSEDCHSDYSDILCNSALQNPSPVRWPIKRPQVAAEKTESEKNMNTTTVEALNPNLCKFCRVFFDTWPSVCDFFVECRTWDILVSAHYDKMSDLKVSASGGCYLCALFLGILQITYFGAHGSSNHLLLDQLKPYRIELDNYITFICKRHEDIGSISNISLSFRSIEDGTRSAKHAGVSMILDNVPDSEHWNRQLYNDTNLSQKYLDELRLGCTEESTALAQAWLQECSSSHTACRQGEDAPVLPTRLIKIDCQEIRLCVSADENCSRYATLSHCWGKVEVLRLQKDNYQDFLKEIPYDKLCKTFRDVITIARFLGFSWLWIDSLCIIQGDSEDWSKEASRMATVYGLSSLNIAATAAPDGTTGCLFERDLRYTEMHKAEVKINNQKQVYTILHDDFYRENIADAPLTKRAWAVQERILAPRTLHFTKSQLFWECRTNRACETFPGTLPEAICDDPSYLPKQELQSWDKIVGIYSQCSLTNESDRLIAIGGVARQHQKKNDDKYFAGLWQSRVIEQLCWHVARTPQRHSGENTWRAPSWSWAAANREVFFPGDAHILDEAYIDVIKLDIALENADDPFGGVKSGVLTLRSKSMIISEIGSPLNNFDSISVGEIPIVPFSIKWDSEDRGLESYRKSILMLPVGVWEESTGYISIEGLLLKHNLQENGQYERIGYFDIRKMDDNYELIRRAMNLTQDEQFKTLGLGNALPSEEDYVSTDVDEDGITWYTISII
ncbi:hypothetical protein BGAL_0018g00050 [Botrytis galanthina]|uniref:Heterokaryon incompatibility domain-containing protein n=1 Tax=Botrytis galanthina TaxID=278940 RepID=A0A4S8RJD6_9HELO|nr:hypothetical protein BGAL_0018g00050 [Botrytis galanthina]